MAAASSLDIHWNASNVRYVFHHILVVRTRSVVLYAM